MWSMTTTTWFGGWGHDTRQLVVDVVRHCSNDPHPHSYDWTGWMMTIKLVVTVGVVNVDWYESQVLEIHPWTVCIIKSSTPLKKDRVVANKDLKCE